MLSIISSSNSEDDRVEALISRLISLLTYEHCAMWPDRQATRNKEGSCYHLDCEYWGDKPHRYRLSLLLDRWDYDGEYDRVFCAQKIVRTAPEAQRWMKRQLQRRIDKGIIKREAMPTQV